MQAPSPRRIGLAPEVGDDARVLILGSLPGEASLRAGQYYGHPRNAFWPLIGGLIGQPALRTQPYQTRLAALRAYGIGLWDVIAEATRTGSLDTAIREPVHTDLNALIAALPQLRAVAFNGGKAAKEGERVLGPDDGRIARLVLPSSSPALAKPLAWKAEHWAILAPYVASPTETA